MNYKNDSYSQSTGNQKLKPAYVDRIKFTHRIQIMVPIFVSYCPYLSFISYGIRLMTLASTYSISRKNTTMSAMISNSEGWINYTRILNIRMSFNFNKGKEGKNSIVRFNRMRNPIQKKDLYKIENKNQQKRGHQPPFYA